MDLKCRKPLSGVVAALCEAEQDDRGRGACRTRRTQDRPAAQRALRGTLMAVIT